MSGRKDGVSLGCEFEARVERMQLGSAQTASVRVSSQSSRGHVDMTWIGFVMLA